MTSQAYVLKLNLKSIQRSYHLPERQSSQVNVCVYIYIFTQQYCSELQINNPLIKYKQVCFALKQNIILILEFQSLNSYDQVKNNNQFFQFVDKVNCYLNNHVVVMCISQRHHNLEIEKPLKSKLKNQLSRSRKDQRILFHSSKK